MSSTRLLWDHTTAQVLKYNDDKEPPRFCFFTGQSYVYVKLVSHVPTRKWYVGNKQRQSRSVPEM